MSLHARRRPAHALLGTRDRTLWLFMATFCLPIYALTANWSNQGVDAESAAWPAWALAHRGSLNLSGIAGLPRLEWFLHAHGELLSNRTIGVVLSGVPINVAFGWTGLGPDPAAALTSVICAAATVATLAVLLRSLVGPKWGLASAFVVGFGTAVWTVDSKELWTHTPDALWLSLSLLGLQRRRYLLAGLAFVPAILTRPHLAVAAALLAVGCGVADRSWRSALRLAALPVVALAAVPVLNHLIYGPWSLTGGYGLLGYTVNSSAQAGAPAGGPVVAPLVNFAGALTSPRCGLLLYTPIALLALATVWRGWREAPAWTKAAAVAGIGYELVQCHINGFTGGSADFFSNRLIVECLILCTPLLAFSVRRWATRPGRVSAAVALSGVSIGIHLIGAIQPSLPDPGNPWTSFYLYDVIRSEGALGVVPTGSTFVLVALAVAGYLSSCGARRLMSRDLASSSAMPATPGAHQSPLPSAAVR
jgi:hypothetical protein